MYRNRSDRGRNGLTPGTRVVGYVRVSTVEQADSGAGMEAQRAAIRVACEQRGWELVRVGEDAGLSAASLGRPGVTAAGPPCVPGAGAVVVGAGAGSGRCAFVALVALCRVLARPPRATASVLTKF